MNKVVQFTEEELEQMLLDELTKGSKFRAVKGEKVSIEFVMSSKGVSALVKGIEPRTNVQESLPVKAPDLRGPTALEIVVHDTIRVLMDDGKARNLDTFVEAICLEIEEQGRDPKDFGNPRYRGAIIKAAEDFLAELVESGAAEFNKKKRMWRKTKKKAPKPVTEGNTAAAILGGDGGVLGRGEALGQGSSPSRPGVLPRRRRGGSSDFDW